MCTDDMHTFINIAIKLAYAMSISAFFSLCVVVVVGIGDIVVAGILHKFNGFALFVFVFSPVEH